jgi:beta-lactamase regulating signal transducer with metallopeptidase domain/Flp pilus assembly protein TadD
MLHWIASNTLVACGIAVLAAVATLALRRQPAAGHLLWLCVLVALIAPPLPKLGVLDGRAHAQRLATQVGQSLSSAEWLRLRTGMEPPTPDTVRPDASGADKPETAASAPGAPAHAGTHTLDPLAHAETCETCRALAASLGKPVADSAESGLSYTSDTTTSYTTPGFTTPSYTTPGYTTPKLVERAAHEAAKRAKADPTTTAQSERAKAAEERAESMPAPSGWKPKPPPTDWGALGASLATTLWLAGAAIALTRLLLGWRSLRALIRAALPASPDFLAEVGATARELGVSPPRVRTSDAIKTPFIVGGPRPVLLWPRGESLDAPGARAVLAHELAHLARRDHWAAWFEALALCLLWWHPLAHLARTQTRALAERACDAWVVWAYPDARRDYADALVAAVERLTRLPRPVPALAAVDSDKRTLARRLVMIMQGNIARRGSRLLAIGAITLTAALAPSWATGRLDAPGIVLTSADIDRSLQPLVDAAKLERLAESHADAEEYDQAIAAYQKLLTLRPDDAGAFHELAMTLYHAGRYSEAAETFAKGGQVAAKQEQAWWKVGGISVTKATEAATKAKAVAEEAMAKAAEHAAQAKELAAAQAEVAKTHAEQAKSRAEQSKALAEKARAQAEQAKAKLAETRAKLAETQATLAASGIEVDIEDQLAGIEDEIDEAVADAMEELAELQEDDWGDLEDAFPDMEDMDDWGDEFDFDFDMDFGGLTPPADWAYNEACCHALAGDQDAAIDALGRAVALGYLDADHAADDGDLSSIHETEAFKAIRLRMVELAEITEFAEQSFEQGQWGPAAEAYAKASKLAPQNGHLSHMLAFAALRNGDTDTAIEGWARALELGYNKPTMLYNLACANALAGNADDAFGYLGKATGAGFDDYELMREDTDLDPVRDDPRFDQILSGVVGAAKLQREIETAVEFEEWSEVVQKAGALREGAPEHSWRRTWAQEKLALGHFYDGRYDQAEDAFADAALAGGDLTNSLYNIACCRSLSGDEAGALDYLHASVDAGWGDAEHLQHDDDLEALRDNPGFEKVIGRAADIEILDMFGAADWDQLLDRSERQIEADPEDGGAHLRLGWALLRTGHPDKAIPVFRRQAELGFEPGIGLYNIACCNAIMGDNDAAIDAIKEAMEAGFNRPEFMADDPDLKNLRADPRFKKLTTTKADSL